MSQPEKFALTHVFIQQIFYIFLLHNPSKSRKSPYSPYIPIPSPYPPIISLPLVLILLFLRLKSEVSGFPNR